MMCLFPIYSCIPCYIEDTVPLNPGGGGGGKALVVRTNAPFYPPAGFKGVFVPGFGAFDSSQWCKPL